MSPGLFYQMCGRGFRLHPGKTDCLVLDFGGNAVRHGPVDQIRIREHSYNGNGESPVGREGLARDPRVTVLVHHDCTAIVPLIAPQVAGPKHVARFATELRDEAVAVSTVAIIESTGGPAR